MSFVYSLFLKRAGEELSQFDNRISNMLPVAAGLVFFDMRNYRNDNGEFNVYIEWNEELNSVLNDRLPSGGYFIKATGKQARQLEEKTGGIPVYMKLIAHEGRLYPYRTYVMWNGRPFSVEFNGNILIPVDYKKKAETVKIQGSQNGSKGNRMDVSGSQMSSSQRSLFGTSQSGLLTGSNREFWTSSNRPWTYEWEYENGSQRSLFGGSQRSLFGTSQNGFFFGSQREFLTGSNRGFFFGSQNGFFFGSNRGYLTGSNREFWTSSNRPWMYEWEYENGSQRSLFSTSQRGIYFGSQREFLTGSNRSFFFGSQRSLSFGSNRGYLTGSRYTPTFYQATDGGADDYDIPHWYYMPPEWQLINRSKRPFSRKGGNSTFGYGLDLI
ncbi:hypothetical protein GT641_06475 [Clostridium sp. BIOML-A1]|jgi:hypothetical protein|uniref:hypothetical protein n=1 Tax=Clostridium sp. BIOML-A1 TaxID=2584627 RepID=UPI0013716F57|nr:hypothetical protein [Clostridium sp. BIOML-A1]MZH16901.1 hypothetical protein [Clostridium sp. BIOML-A1]